MKARPWTPPQPQRSALTEITVRLHPRARPATATRSQLPGGTSKLHHHPGGPTPNLSSDPSEPPRHHLLCQLAHRQRCPRRGKGARVGRLIDLIHTQPMHYELLSMLSTSDIRGLGGRPAHPDPADIADIDDAQLRHCLAKLLVSNR